MKKKSVIITLGLLVILGVIVVINNSFADPQSADWTLLNPGLYDDNNNLVASWETLVNDYGFDMTTDEGCNYSYSSYNNRWVHYGSNYSSTTVTIDQVPTSIPYRALMEDALSTGTTLVLPNSLEKIGSCVLENNPLTKIYIPNSVNEIGSYAFRDNGNLEVVIENEESDLGFITSAKWANEYSSLTSSDLENPRTVGYTLYGGGIWYKLSGDTTSPLETLLASYNVITLGTKDKSSISSFPYDVSTYQRGSVLNVYSIGGPVLVRGDVTGRYGNGLERHTSEAKNFPPEMLRAPENNTNSYIGGKLIGGKETSTSLEIFAIGRYGNMYSTWGNNAPLYLDKDQTEIDCIDNSNIQYSNSGCAITSMVIHDKDDLNVDFDSLYNLIVEEQSKIKKGTQLSFTSTSYTQDEEVLNITTPGNYNVNLDNIDGFAWKSKVINIKNYDPTKTYVITVEGEYIYTPLELRINNKDPKDITPADAVYSGYTYANERYNNGSSSYEEMYSGNIIVSYPEAKYIYFNKESVGHIIAPNADVEINSWKMIGAIIANSIVMESDYDANTAIQFYPYQGDNLELNTTAYQYNTSTDNEIYNGNHSLLEMIKNYNVVTLGQKNYYTSSQLKTLTDTKGTVTVPQISGPILVSGDLGTNIGERINAFTYTAAYNGNKNFESSYIKGTLKTAGTNSLPSDNIKYNMNSKEIYLGTSNNVFQSLGYHTPYWYETPNKSNIVSSSNSFASRIVADFNSVLSTNGNYSITKPVFNTDTYINFQTLYNTIQTDQNNLPSGISVYPDSDGVLHLSNGGIYTIEDITSVSKIVFDTAVLDKLTIVNIKANGSIINFPKVYLKQADSCDSQSANTNRYYNYHTAIDPTDTIVTQEQYKGNLIWNIPNATYINIPQSSFIGHVVAPNADIEMNNVALAGTIIANSLYAINGQVNYYPYQLSTLVPTTTTIRIYNVDGLTFEDLDGFKYEIYDQNNTKIGEWTTGNECTNYYENTNIVPAKTYRIKQVSNVNPYVKLDVIKFSTSSNGNVTITGTDATTENHGDLTIKNLMTGSQPNNNQDPDPEPSPSPSPKPSTPDNIEKTPSKTPSTGDLIMKYVTLAIISGLGLFIAILLKKYFKKKNK